MSFTRSRASRLASSCPKDFDFQFFIFQDEGTYMMFYGTQRFLNWLNDLPEHGGWNALIAVLWLLSSIIVNTQWTPEPVLMEFSYADLIDMIFNFCYAIHLLAIIYYDTLKILSEQIAFKWIRIGGYFIDVTTYFHYFVEDEYYIFFIKLGCYYCRIHRPMRYLWDLNDFNLKGTVFATLLKYLFIFAAVRLFYGFTLVSIKFVDYDHKFIDPPSWLEKQQATLLFRAYFVAHKCFLGLGVDFNVNTNLERIVIIILATSGTVLVLGITITWVALIMCIYMRNGELFRMRFRLIKRDMVETNIPIAFRDKVEAYYRMYWHKQKAVSTSELLYTFPATLTNSVITDIYFEALQKSRILRDLSYQFLSEIAKVMQTINYVPGDIIVKRNSPKSTMYFIKYGDIEVLTAEDDETPILRFTRGTIINPCAGCMEVAGARAHVAVRAATFCTAHVLRTQDLWHAAAKYGRINGQSFILHSSFEEHFEKVKKHYKTKTPFDVKFKSSILLLKRNLIDLKCVRDINGELIMGRNDKFIEIAGCFIMRNRADTSLTEDIDAICLRPTFPCILQPNSSLQFAWATTVSIFTFVVFIAYPYQLIYHPTVPEEFRFFNLVVNVIYALDCMAHLSTGANIEEGVPVTFTQTSSEQAKSIWFLLDVISTIPFLYFVGDGHFAGLNKLLRFPKVFKYLLRLDQMWLQQSYIMRTFIFIIFMSLVAYLMATIVQAFVCYGHGRCMVDNYTNEIFWTKAPLEANKGSEDLIIISLYWVLALITFTTIRTANQSKNNWQGQLMEMFLLELSTIIRICTDSTFSATICVIETLSDAYGTCIKTVTEFFSKNNVSFMLQHRFLSYLQLCWYVDKAFSLTYEKHILFDLPTHVRSELQSLQRTKYLKNLPIMKLATKEDLKQISTLANIYYSSPNEILLNTGDLSNEIYVIRKGYCDVIDPETKEVVRVISSGGHFGEVECLLRIPTYYSIKATTHVQVIFVTRKDLAKFLIKPKVVKAIKELRADPKFSELMRKRASFLKYEIPKPPPSIERFPLLRKHEPDTAFLAPFQRLGFFSILRYVFPRFTIRPDGTYLRRYEIFRLCCSLLSAMVFPTYTWLLLQWPNLYYLAFFLDIAALLDVFQRMLIAYFNEKGILVYHPASTAANYVKGAFLTDLAACFPLESLDSMRNYIFYSEGLYRQESIYQYLLYNRLIQLYRVPNAIEMFKDYIGRDDLLLIIKGIPMFMTLTAFATSMLMEASATKYQPEQHHLGTAWRIESKAHPVQGDWLTIYHNVFVRYNITATPWNFFLTTYYWIINETTTTGYGLFVPTAPKQLKILISCVFLGNLMTTYFAVRIISIRANVNQSLAAFQQHMKDLVTYMQRESLDKELQKEAIAYYNYSWDKTGGTDYRKVLKLCAQISLRTDAIVHIYGTTFGRCPILRHTEVSLLRLLGRGVYSMYFPEGMTILEYNDICGDLYFIDFGTVEVFAKGAVVTKLPRGSVFGNLNNSTTKCLIPNRIVTTANVHLLKIHTKSFFEIIKDFPKVQQLIDKHRPNKKESYIIGSVGTSSKVVTTWKERALSSIVMLQAGKVHVNIQGKLFQIYLIAICLVCYMADVYNAAFMVNTAGMISLLYVLDFAFLIKILLNYIVPYFSEEDTEARQVLMQNRKKYFQQEFQIDLMSCMPIEAFAFIDRNNPWQLFALLRLNRSFRLLTVQKCLKRYYEKLNINLTLTTVTMVLIWFAIFVHAVACIWYKIAIFEDGSHPKSSWRYNSDGNRICDREYFCSLYFVLTTFMQNGVGDIMPRQQPEVAFTLVLMILATMMFMVYVGEFSNVIQFQAFRLFEYYSSKLECEQFLRNNRVAPTLVTMVKKYILYLWREQRGIQMPYFLQEAPHNLRLQIMCQAYLYHLTTHELFKNCEHTFLRILIGCCRLHTYMEEMFVVQEGEITDSMYFIHKGTIKEMSDDFEEELRDFETGNNFGTANGLVYGLAYPYSYKTITKAQILSLNLKHWEYLLEHFPVSREVIFKKPDKDYDVCKVKEKKKGASAPAKIPRVLFQGDAASSALELKGIPSGRSLSDITLMEPNDRWIPPRKDFEDLKAVKQETSKPVEEKPSWPMFSRFSVAATNDQFTDEQATGEDEGHKSTEHDTDKEVTARKFFRIEGETKEPDLKAPSFAAQGRRKSTVMGTDKKAVQMELDRIAELEKREHDTSPKGEITSFTDQSQPTTSAKQDDPPFLLLGRKSSDIFSKINRMKKEEGEEFSLSPKQDTKAVKKTTNISSTDQFKPTTSVGPDQPSWTLLSRKSSDVFSNMKPQTKNQVESTLVGTGKTTVPKKVDDFSRESYKTADQSMPTTKSQSEEYHWPSIGRKSSDVFSNMKLKTKDKKEISQEEMLKFGPFLPPPQSRRKSTVMGTDKKAVEKELESISVEVLKQMPSRIGSDKGESSRDMTLKNVKSSTSKKSSTDEIELTTIHYADESSKSDYFPITDQTPDKALFLSDKVPVPSEVSIKSERSNLYVDRSEDYEAAIATPRRKSLVEKIKDQFSTKPRDDKPADYGYQKEDPAHALLKSVETKLTVDKKPSQPVKLRSSEAETVPKKKKGGLGFKDEVTKISVPSKEETTTAEELGTHHSDLYFQKMLSYAQSPEFKGVEDYMEKESRPAKPEGSQQSLFSLESMASVASVASLDSKASSVWSVETFMMNKNEKSKEQKKKRVSLADDLQDSPASSGSLPNMSMSSEDTYSSLPPSWMTGPMNLEILDHRLLEALSSRSTSRSESVSRY